jgi:hypothetical protein
MFVAATNELTKKLTEGGDKRRRETSSRVRLDDSCIRNALLGMVKGTLNCNVGGVLKVTGFLSWWKAVTFQTRGCRCWWEIITSGDLFFMKRISVGWLSGS